MGPDPPVGEGPRGVSPPGGMADGGHGTQTAVIRDVGVTIHWSGAGNGGIGGDQDIYRPQPDHGRVIYCNPSYHGLLLVGGADAWNGPIQDFGGIGIVGEGRTMEIE